MKQFLLFSSFILFPLLSFSQMYKIDEMRTYSWNGAPDWALENTAKYTYGNEGNKETKLELINRVRMQPSKITRLTMQVTI